MGSETYAGMSLISDRFGFLPLTRAVTFDDGYVEPVVDIAERIKEVEDYTHPDAIVFPPLTREHVSFPPRFPQSTAALRPAVLFKLPVTHSITIATPVSSADFRRADGAFLVYFLGHMFSYRLQFENWWHDGPIPMHGRRWSYLRETEEGEILSTAYRTWRAWPVSERTRFTNLLYMHVRSFSYEWDWERFTVRYMVFDGCYRMAVGLGLAAPVPHAKRLDAMFRSFGLVAEPGQADIVQLRNELFHEALWDGGQPGTGSRKGFMHADSLWRINDRLLFALAGYRGPYLGTPWSDIGMALI